MWLGFTALRPLECTWQGLFEGHHSKHHDAREVQALFAASVYLFTCVITETQLDPQRFELLSLALDACKGCWTHMSSSGVINPVDATAAACGGNAVAAIKAWLLLDVVAFKA